MKRFIERAAPPMRPWLWFGLLWCAGLLGALLLALPIKILVYFLKS